MSSRCEQQKKYEPLFVYKRVRQISHAGRIIKELIKKGPFVNHILVFDAHVFYHEFLQQNLLDVHN